MTIVEPGGFRTDFAESSTELREGRPEYDATVGKTARFQRDYNGKQPGDQTRAAAALLKLASVKEPPLRIVLGIDALTPAPVAVEETDVPALAEGERHQDLGHGSGSFPWKLGLEGDILPCREGDEACSDAPAADALLECFSLVNGHLEPTQELPNLI